MQSVWIFGDQLSPSNSALLAAERREHRVVLMIESKARGTYLRYHQQKLVLIYSAMRHFAEDLRAAGWEVDYHRLEDTPTFEAGLRRHVAKYHPDGFLVSEPNDFIMTDLVRKVGRKFRLKIETFPSTQFYLSREEFSAWAGTRQWLVMEVHYRELRKRTGYLMEADDKPTGGAWKFDVAGRQTFRAWERAGKPRSHQAVREEPDTITREVIALVEREFPDHPGNARDFWLPVDRVGALRWLDRFVEERLEGFGQYEELMSIDESVFFHSVVSAVLNIGLISPHECCEAALTAFEDGHAPLHSVEGFIRQILGWREFVNGVYWHRGPEYKTLNALGANRPLPEWFRTREAPTNCLQHTIRTALDSGWTNHSQRLVVLGSFFLFAGIRPSDVMRWYAETMVDAFDWVLAANVLGITLSADGGYVGSTFQSNASGYIDRMSDYCRGCRFRPEVQTGPEACPFNYLYWEFIARHAARLSKSQQLRVHVQVWAKMPAVERGRLREAARGFLEEYVPMEAGQLSYAERCS